MNNLKYNTIVFNAFKKQYYTLKSQNELENAKKDFIVCKEQFGIYTKCIESFITQKEIELKNKSLNDLIKPIEEVEPITFNLKGLGSVKDKINKINNVKLCYEFNGLFNLLSDRINLTYNSLYVRSQIIKDLNKFKSLRFFKVGYITKYNLKSEYRYLAFKNDAKKEHSKLYFIKSGLYVLKTLHHDNLSLKVFYIGNRYKTLLKHSNTYKKVLKEDKYNLSSTEAYKVLDKKDNMKYYSYCNSIGLDKSNRQLLRSIRKSKRPSKDSLIDYLEDRRNDILEDMKISSELEVLYLEIELQDIKEKLQELKTFEEDNSMEDKTYLSDYLK